MPRKRYGHKRGKENGPPFVQLFHWMTDSRAWRDLGTVSQAVYIALKRYYNGSNNGAIGLSCRQAAEAIGMHYSTTARALRKLTEHGFIVEVTKGFVGRGSGYNKATEWLLEECRDDRTGKPPSKTFLELSKNKNTVAGSVPSVAPLPRNGTPLPQERKRRSARATPVPTSTGAALHPGNTLTSSHMLEPTLEARGAAGAPTRSKPRVSIISPAGARPSTAGDQRPPEDLVDPGSPANGPSRAPPATIPVSAELRAILGRDVRSEPRRLMRPTTMEAE